ncbi:MAG: pyrroloquinoline quinone precursor peptide PqqA [Rhodospirillum sp.]|nr:pyrroloquinoline quinone precursor peptide PqqA [Rhodospirillum sp.]MCF8488894.1 pyrroloquinoline quinone precursor peptide PqqA [Rhodospirillum sp.]MCF8500044.1 pyrroloquinoline quinone precursor peptide PqqA [Rhodospirillum sp.]
MEWTTPEINEIDCGAEICAYAPADEGDMPLF